MGYHSPCLDAFFLCPMLKGFSMFKFESFLVSFVRLNTFKIFEIYLFRFELVLLLTQCLLKILCSFLFKLFCCWGSSFCMHWNCQSIASFLKVYSHSLEEFFQVLQHIFLCNPGHNILAIFNNLAYIWITTSKTILDI